VVTIKFKGGNVKENKFLVYSALAAFVIAIGMFAYVVILQSTIVSFR